jgi:hypothetical protein
MSTTKEQIEKLKEIRVNEILYGPGSYQQKLKSFREERLFDVSTYYVNFEDFLHESNKLDTKFCEHAGIVYDEILENTDRYRNLYFEWIMDDFDRNTTLTEDYKILIKTLIFMYAVKNKTYGFQFDW